MVRKPLRVIALSALLISALTPVDAQTAAPAGDPVSPITLAASNPVSVQVVTLALPQGQHLRLLAVQPPHPWATIVMLPGGSGEIGLQSDGQLRHGDNFVTRTRFQWAAKGYAVVIPDADAHSSLRGQRSTPDYAQRLARLIAFAHSQTPGPVFLLGTSQGAIAAMNGAAHAAPEAIAGVVLSESVAILGGSHETVFSADPEAVTAPALIIANRDDTCPVAPPTAAPKIAAAMTHARTVEILYVAGGRNQSHRACGSLTPHGYDGVEAEVIADIDGWMHRQARSAQ